MKSQLQFFGQLGIEKLQNVSLEMLDPLSRRLMTPVTNLKFKFQVVIFALPIGARAKFKVKTVLQSSQQVP